jgi:hypothetical protein
LATFPLQSANWQDARFVQNPGVLADALHLHPAKFPLQVATPSVIDPAHPPASHDFGLPHVLSVGAHRHPANEPLQVALPSSSKVPWQLLASHFWGFPHVMVVGVHLHPANDPLQVASPSESKVPPQLLESQLWGFPHVMVVGVHLHPANDPLHVACPSASKVPAQLLALHDWGVPQNPGVDELGVQGQPEKGLPEPQAAFPASTLPEHILTSQLTVGLKHPALPPSVPSSGSIVGHDLSVVDVVVAVIEQPDTMSEDVVLQEIVDESRNESHDTNTSVTVVVLHLELVPSVVVPSSPPPGGGGGGGPIPGGKQKPQMQGIQMGSGGITHGIKSLSKESVVVLDGFGGDVRIGGSVKVAPGMVVKDLLGNVMVWEGYVVVIVPLPKVKVIGPMVITDPLGNVSVNSEMVVVLIPLGSVEVVPGIVVNEPLGSVIVEGGMVVKAGPLGEVEEPGWRISVIPGMVLSEH